jgi:hypothetical protein
MIIPMPLLLVHPDTKLRIQKAVGINTIIAIAGPWMANNVSQPRTPGAFPRDFSPEPDLRVKKSGRPIRSRTN